MSILLLIIGVLLSGFAVAGLSGAPWVPSRRAEAIEALAHAKLAPGQTFCDLGCGTGTTLILAAKTGARVTGVELNPLLWLVAKLRLARTPNASVRLASLWRYNVSSFDVVYVFLMPRFMNRVGVKFGRELKPGARALSYTFQIPGKRPTWHNSSAYLYHY